MNEGYPSSHDIIVRYDLGGGIPISHEAETYEYDKHKSLIVDSNIHKYDL